MHTHPLETYVLRVETAHNPVLAVQQIVEETGGIWSAHSPASQVELFQLQIGGIQGAGIGAAAAISDWLSKAQEHLRLNALSSPQED